MGKTDSKLSRLRQVITENLRVQRDGEAIDYINIGTALNDACAKQNHAIFARRGCGKTLLLQHSSPAQLRNVDLNPWTVTFDPISRRTQVIALPLNGP